MYTYENTMSHEIHYERTSLGRAAILPMKDISVARSQS